MGKNTTIDLRTEPGAAKFPPDGLTFDAFVTVRLSATAAIVEECARAMLSDGHFLNITELRILGYLKARSEASVSTVSRDLGVDKAWISRRIKSMEKRGLVASRKGLEDTRTLMVFLTTVGAQFYDQIRADVVPYYSAIVEGIDVELLFALLDRLEANVRSVKDMLQRPEG
ncbi:transcriptional regulator [Novosphingobium endophyticum]|uniref:Transcriptional regulator n=1 Tax=Novosphingobium endophyticum TaxID=1955250 RepID=A0A916TX80_9SPHN|nr:MarR family winged helix-turn-helix transcriptional regulator [Novosphingobium endophyticum]GGC16174.1 transcriptional regulator [Novosphingobium endophyticum]